MYRSRVRLSAGGKPNCWPSRDDRRILEERFAGESNRKNPLGNTGHKTTVTLFCLNPSDQSQTSGQPKEVRKDVDNYRSPKTNAGDAAMESRRVQRNFGANQNKVLTARKSIVKGRCLKKFVAHATLNPSDDHVPTPVFPTRGLTESSILNRAPQFNGCVPAARGSVSR